MKPDEKLIDKVLAVLRETPGRELQVSYIRKSVGSPTRYVNKALSALVRRGSVGFVSDGPSHRVRYRALHLDTTEA